MTFLDKSDVRQNNGPKSRAGVYLFVWLIISSFLVRTTEAWDSDELELFDLVEEINTNFYQLLGITQVK